MKNLELIATIGRNREMGCRNHLLWCINDDNETFKKLTLNKDLIMGMKTYINNPRNVHFERKDIVLTKKNILNPNVKICNYKEEVLCKVNKHQEKEYIIIGGGEIFNLFINDVHIMYLMEVDQEYLDSDTKFPEFNAEEFDKELLLEGKQGHIEYKQYKYTRR